MKLTIFKRLTFGYAAILLLVVFLGVYVTLKLNQLNGLSREIATVHVNRLTLTEHFMDKLFSQVGFMKKYLISRDTDFLKKFWEIQFQLIKNIRKLEALPDMAENKDLFSQIQTDYGQFLLLFKTEIEALKSNSNYPCLKFQQQKDNLVDQINQRLMQMIYISRLQRDKKINAASQISSRVLQVTTITTAVAILLGLLISFYNTRGITRSIVRLQKMTREIAKGKFEEIDNITSPPEIKDLSEDFNLMCERLRELDEMKKDFVSHVSHTLRTPLTAMKEASRMLMEGTYADVPAKQNELLAIMQKECERLIDSVNRILDLSRMEANMMDYQLKRGQLFPLIQQTVLKLAPIAQRKKIDLELRPSPNLPAIKMDEERIAQVMENLIGNALKFSASGGKVIIAASLKNQGQHRIEVCVADRGCGIPRENMGKIFERFQRIDGGRKTPLGTGLGLSIAKHIVADHGGKIWVRSKPGQGSSFYFSLPVL
ncbi:MAG: ATP-binding protein [Desulfobacterales bacterium]